MTTVRVAGSGDVEAVLGMWRAMHQESPVYRDERLCPDKLRRLLRDLCAEGPLSEMGTVFVADRAGELVGVAGVLTAERWFGPDRYATDLTVYVRPQHRGGRAFPMLVRALEAWAQAHAVGKIELGVSTGVHTESTVRAYERQGYTISPTRIVTKRLEQHV